MIADKLAELQEAIDVCLIDWEILQRLSEGDEDFEWELVQMFLTSTQINLEKIRVAIANNDLLQLTKESHYLKGASANIGATAMCLTAGKLEQLVRQQQIEGAADLLVELEQLISRIQALLQEREKN